MCVLCSQLWVEDHWADAAVTGAGGAVVALETHATRRGQRLRDRAERARLVSRIVAGRRLTLQDWEGSSYILRDATGRSAVISDLAQVWAEAERMLGASLDPLDPGLIQELHAKAAPPEAQSLRQSLRSTLQGAETGQTEGLQPRARGF